MTNAMDNNSTRKDAIEKIAILLYQKGYRGKFSYGERGLSMVSDVKACFHRFLERYDRGEYPGGMFEMEMIAPYDPALTCHFRLNYDEEAGFRIERFTVCNLKTNDSKWYPLQNNNQLPGSQTIYSLFPKPKPWDNIRKGKFRL